MYNKEKMMYQSSAIKTQKPHSNLNRSLALKNYLTMTEE